MNKTSFFEDLSPSTLEKITRVALFWNILHIITLIFPIAFMMFLLLQSNPLKAWYHQSRSLKILFVVSLGVMMPILYPVFLYKFPFLNIDSFYFVSKKHPSAGGDYPTEKAYINNKMKTLCYEYSLSTHEHNKNILPYMLRSVISIVLAINVPLFVVCASLSSILLGLSLMIISTSTYEIFVDQIKTKLGLTPSIFHIGLLALATTSILNLLPAVINVVYVAPRLISYQAIGQSFPCNTQLFDKIDLEHFSKELSSK